MRTATTKSYTDEDIARLSGEIRKSTYAGEVQKALKELKKGGEARSINYITQVVNGYMWNEKVWDAVVVVLQERKVEKKIRSVIVDQAFSG